MDRSYNVTEDVYVITEYARRYKKELIDNNEDKIVEKVNDFIRQALKDFQELGFEEFKKKYEKKRVK